MKALLRGHLKKKLAQYAQARLSSAKKRPTIITITGSIGKTSTKEAIAAAIGDAKTVLLSEGNYNTAYGVPLTILGLKGGEGSFTEWKTVLDSAKDIVSKPWDDAPDVIVLEYAVDRPGDMDELMQIVVPDIAVITPIPDMPVHGKFFPSAEALAEEKGKMIAGLSKGVALLSESKLSRDLGRKTGMVVKGYGWEEKNDVRVAKPELILDENGPHGMSGKIFLEGSTMPMRLSQVIAPTQFLAAAVGVAVAKELGLNPIETLARLKDWEPPKRRMELKRIPDGAAIIDDTYNASPEAAKAALKLLAEFPTPQRRVAVIGDMRELDPSVEEKAHKEVGKLAGESASNVIFVGERSEWLATGARGTQQGDEIQTASDGAEVARLLQELDIKEGDTVLFKASRAVGLDEVVDALVGA